MRENGLDVTTVLSSAVACTIAVRLDGRAAAFFAAGLLYALGTKRLQEWSIRRSRVAKSRAAVQQEQAPKPVPATIEFRSVSFTFDIRRMPVSVAAAWSSGDAKASDLMLGLEAMVEPHERTLFAGLLGIASVSEVSDLVTAIAEAGTK